METLSLDDIIQQKFPKSTKMRGKRGAASTRRGPNKPSAKGWQSNPNNQNKFDNKIKRVGRGGAVGRRGVRGGINRTVPALVGDARSRIIQQKRNKITDAREKLGAIAKMNDARVKLNKLHGIEMRPSRVNLRSEGKLTSRGGITIQTDRNGKMELSTNKSQHIPMARNPYSVPSRRSPNHGRLFNTIYNSLVDNDMDMDDEPLPMIRRTVNLNAASPAASSPMFAPLRQREVYTWTKPQTIGMIDLTEPGYKRISRSPTRPQILRESILEPGSRSQRPVGRTLTRTSPRPQHRSDEWFHHEIPIKRTTRVSRPTPQPRPQVVYSDEDDDMEPVLWSNSKSAGGVKSRLDANLVSPHSMGILAAETKATAVSTSSPSPAPANYHRIIVSNLQKNVTNEDIRELFEDIGSLVLSKLVRPGTAEVVYRSRKDAIKAVDLYHNRQLDGEPMKCMLVNSSSRNIGNTSGSQSHFRGPTSSKFPVSRKSTIYPDMDTIHKALFKRS